MAKTGLERGANQARSDAPTAKAPMGKNYPQRSSGVGGSTPGFPKTSGLGAGARFKAKRYGG